MESRRRGVSKWDRGCKLELDSSRRWAGLRVMNRGMVMASPVVGMAGLYSVDG